MDSDDIKWKSVETTSREILYYSNKITGQQKWTNKNCYCSKPKNQLQTTLPCCYKMSSTTLKPARKGYTEHSYARKKTHTTLSKKLYCLSDIVNEVQKSFLTKGHRKHKKKKCDITLDFKKNLIAIEDPKSKVRITKDPLNDEITEQYKDDVIFIIDSQNDVNVSKDSKNEVKTVYDDKEFPKDLKNDVNVTLDLKDDSSFTNEGTKNDLTAKDDCSSDVNVFKDPVPLSKEPKNYVVDIKDTKNDLIIVDKGPKDVIVSVDKDNDVSQGNDSDSDVTVKDVILGKENDDSEAKDSNDVLSNEPSKTNDVIVTENMDIDITTVDDFNNDVDVAKDPKNVFVSTDEENDVTEEKDSNNVLSNEPSKNNVILTENMEIDVTAIDDFRNDVAVAKDPKNEENNVSEVKASNDDISNEPSKLKEAVIIRKRGLKRKREVINIVNGYKGRLRVRQNKIQRTIRRKYRRRKTLKNATAVPNPSVQPDSGDTPKNLSKRKKLEVDNKVLQTDYDIIEQSIIEINNSIISEGSESISFSFTTPDLTTTSEKNHNKTSEVPVEVSHLRFIDEKFLRMNIPFQSLAEVDNKKSIKSKTIGPKKKPPVYGKNRHKVLPTVRSSTISLNLPVVTQTSSSSSLTSVSKAGRGSIQAKSYVKNETSNQRHSKYLSDDRKKSSCNQADENDGSKTLSSPDLVNTNQSSLSSGKCNFPPNRNQSQRSLDEIVNCMKSPNKVEVPLTSTVSMSCWSTILSKELKEDSKSKPATKENDFSGKGTSLNTEETGGRSHTNDVGAGCPESEPLVFGHIKDAFSLATMPQMLSIEPVSQESSQLFSGHTHVKKPDFRKVEAGSKTNTCEAGTNTTGSELLSQTLGQDRNVTEVPASYVDLSWRIVTTSDGHSSSLSNFFKLVPITIARGPSGTVDAQEPISFLGVPVHGGPAVIAKILNTSGAENCNEIFSVSRKPNIETAGTYVKKSTLSFVWESDAVLVNSESLKEGNLSGKDVKPRPPVWIDNCNRVSIILPKPLRLPQAGNVIYLGEFNVKVNIVEFVVTHSVVVTKSPRPSLTVPSGTPVNPTSTVSHAIRCRSPKKAKNDAPAAKKIPLGRKMVKGNIRTFQKCVFCGTELVCQRDVKIHRKLHATYAGTKCSECKRRFHNGGRLSVHLNTHKCDWLHICIICQNPYRTPKFLTPVDLVKDYYKMCLPCRRKELKCKKCRERLLTFEDLELHLKEKHGLHCPICKCSFFFKRDLIKHMYIEHGLTSVPPSVSTSRS